jgi:heme-degrading monooxygenase HmoA
MIGVYIRPTGMTEEKYKSIDDQLRASGAEPKGVKMHSCFGEGEGVAIFDIWESEEDFNAFAAHLGPIVAAAGLEPLAPMFVPIVAFEVS